MSYVLTSLSGNLISAASAGFAPTNSADVSAIASAYATGGVDSATVSAIASAYVESGVSSKQDTLSFGYDDSAISSINGSALAGGGAGGDYVEKSATEVTIGSSNTASSTSFAQGIGNTASYRSFAQGAENSAAYDSFALGLRNTASNTDFAQGNQNFASSRSFAHGDSNSASILSFAQGRNVSARSAAAVFGQYNLHGNGDTATGDSAAFAIGNGTASDARHDLMLVTKDGEITMFSSTADTIGTGIMSSIRALSANAGGVDSATVSAIASAYAESAASSKLDTTAYNSGDFYSTSNPSGFIDSSYVDSAVSSKADSSALSSYALSADVSGTVDLVSTQSANWGGSALALSAGPGVKLEKVGDTLVASLDRTLLWSGTRNLSATGTWALSGNPYDYEQVQIWARPHNTHKTVLGCTVMPNLDSNSVTDVCIMGVQDALTHVRFNLANLRIDSSGFYVNSSKQISVPETTANSPTILTMVYGINRTAGV